MPGALIFKLLKVATPFTAFAVVVPTIVAVGTIDESASETLPL